MAPTIGQDQILPASPNFDSSSFYQSFEAHEIKKVIYSYLTPRLIFKHKQYNFTIYCSACTACTLILLIHGISVVKMHNLCLLSSCFNSVE